MSVWHNHPELLVDQIESYNAAFDGDLIHCININALFEQSFAAEVEKKGVDFSRFGNVHFTSFNVPTAWAMITQAYFHAVLDSIMKGRRFDYVYFHTASDLLIKHGANRHIRKHDVGFAKSPGAQFTLKTTEGRTFADVETEAQAFREAMRLDPRLPAVLQGMGVDRVYKSRAEGCFFRRDLFFEIMYPLLCHTSIADMADLPKAYPIEEYLFATCVEFFCSRHKVRRTRHVVTSSTKEKGRASVEEMEEVLANPLLFGIKRFSQALDDPQRAYARQLLA